MKFAVLAVAAFPAASGAVVGRGQSFLGNGMQPEVVARTLAHVEDEWKAQAAVFAECDSTSGLPGASIVNCADAPSSFGKSCNTVVSAIVTGSGGDKDVAKEYMSDVCSQNSITGWHHDQCQQLATSVKAAMSADKYANRMSFNSAKLCDSFWKEFLDGEKKRMEQEKAEREAAEKKAAEEEAKKKEEEEAKKKEEAEKAKVEAAQHAKEEAKKMADEAAARLAEKKAEAEAVQAAAQKKMQEAEAAEQESKKAAEKRAAAVQDAAEKANATETETKPVEVSANATETENAPVLAQPAAQVKEEAPVTPKAAPAKAEEAKPAPAAEKPAAAPAVEKSK